MAIAVASSLSSCLDETPLYSQNNNVVFASESNAELALLGCYSYMASTSAYGQMYQETPVTGSGFGWSQRSGSDGIVSLQTLSSDGLISTTWNGMYKVISEANAFLENLDKVLCRKMSRLSLVERQSSCVHWLIITWFPCLETFL